MNQDNNQETQRKQKMLRLSEAANKALRASTSYHGDVSKAINHAILGTDLATVKVFPRNRSPFLGNKPTFNTSAVFEPGVYEMVQEAAAKRGVSAIVLIDGVIIDFYGPRAAKGEKNVESDSSNHHQPKGRGR